MEQGKVDLFILNKGSMFPPTQIPFIRERLLHADDDKWVPISMAQFRNPLVALILSIGCGVYGADRFYLGYPILGALKLLLTIAMFATIVTGSICRCESWAFIASMAAVTICVLLWYFIDIFLVTRITREQNYAILLEKTN